MLSPCRVKIPHSERKKDPWWVHAERLEGNRTHWKCKYCNQVFKGGGVSRLKMHIAGFAGDIVSCPAVPQEIRESTKAELEKRGKKLEPRKRKYKGKSKEAVTMDESNPLQIVIATGDVPTKAEFEKRGKKLELRKRKYKGKSKEAVTMDESNRLQIVLATGDVPAPGNGLLPALEKQAKKCTPKRKKQNETSNAEERKEDTLDKDVEKRKEMNKGKEREEGTMVGKEIGEAPAATGDC